MRPFAYALAVIFVLGGFAGCGDTIPSSEPQDVTVSAASDSQIDISWSKPETTHADIDHYNIYRDGTLLAEATSKSYSDTGLSAATSYCYSISATDVEDSESDDSSEVCATTSDDSTVPEPPGTLQATVYDSDVYLDWTDGTDNGEIAGYYIYQDSSFINSTTSTDYWVEGLEALTEYCFSVSTVDEAGNESDLTSEVCVTTGGDDEVAPDTPTNVSATVSMTEIVLEWDESSDNVGISYYEVEWYEDGTSTTYTSTTTTTGYTLSGLSPGETYCYTVTAYDTSGNASDATSEECSTATADTSAPTTPANFVAAAKALDLVVLDWNASTDDIGVTAYNIYSYTSGSLINSVTDTEYKHSGLTGSTSYCYQVKAEDAAGNESSASTLDCETTTTTYAVGGLVVGLTGSLTLLQNLDEIDVTGEGDFYFTGFDNSVSYDVTVEIGSITSGQICTPYSNTGTISGASVTNVLILCQ